MQKCLYSDKLSINIKNKTTMVLFQFAQLWELTLTTMRTAVLISQPTTIITDNLGQFSQQNKKTRSYDSISLFISDGKFYLREGCLEEPQKVSKVLCY
jgi:hypothetical protein